MGYLKNAEVSKWPLDCNEATGGVCSTSPIQDGLAGFFPESWATELHWRELRD
jgi:hypothetical protein